MDVKLGDEGGGDIEVVLGADPELVDLAAQAGVDPLSRLADRVEGLEGPWSVEDRIAESDPGSPVTGGGGREVVVRASFADPAEFALLYGQIQEALDAPEATLAGPMELSVDEEADTISLAGTAVLAVTDVATADLGVSTEDLNGQVAEVVDYQVRITTPAPPLPDSTDPGVATGEDLEGEHVVTIAPAPGQAEAFVVVFTPPGLDLADLVLPVGGGAAAVALIGLGVVAERRRVRG